MNELVLINPNDPKGQKVTTSLLVAEKFHKSHGKVLRDIANLSCSEDFMRANFGLHEYIDGRGNKQPMYYITKDGFLFLVLGYNGRDAGKLKEKFIDAFNQGQEAIQILGDDNAIVARALEILDKRNKALEIEVEQKQEQLQLAENTIKEIAPKAKYHDEVLMTKNGHPITVIADDLGISAIKLNKILVQWGVQRKVGGTYVLTVKYQNRGYTSSYTHKFWNEKTSKEESKKLTTWTEEGRKFIHDGIDKLKNQGKLF